MTKQSIFKSIIGYTGVSITIAFFIGFINFLATGYQARFLYDINNLSINFSYAFIIGMVNLLAFSLLYQKYSWENDAKKLLFIGVIGSIIWSTLAFLLARVVHIVFIEGYSFQKFIKNESAITYIIALLIAFVVTLAYHVVGFYKALQDSKLKEKTFESESHSAKFDALKNQLDPHFLFNSLNVLSALIDENPEKAQDFTVGLSKVYRYVLDQKHKDLVSVQDEIKFAKTYLNLLKMRFENSIDVQIDDAISKIEAKIIPLSLQLLLENAVKHNRISEKQPLVIKIYIENKCLVIQNNFQPKVESLSQKRNGIGLENIKSRYNLFTDEKCLATKTEKNFIVKLPLLQLQNN
ncbi:sensor histidine kinase [Flavobacteriaceae bacterium 14752]|uniref:sensor histidine kinase n=1 Tax=Mesohalobacter salilacus TaxID=2491711 RepID=UPI000F62CC7A|nr:histidine kinase [Flavobacteriaceae bacterium 14752]